MKKIFEKFSNPSSETYLIVGLGNPGKEHRNNRHNIGFMVVDAVAKKIGVEFTRVQSKALVTKGEYDGYRLILAKPQTFMNLSGQAVGALARFYKLKQENILIIFDDVDLPLETLRLRPEGGSSGQKGMKSIIQALGVQEFPRLRVGIGRPPGKMQTPDYVLQNFSKQEEDVLPFVLDRASEAVLKFVADGIEEAMNTYNQKP